MINKNDKEQFIKEEMHKKAIENVRKVIEIVNKNKEKLNDEGDEREWKKP